MWFKNKNTGLVWEVVDEEVMDRLKNDPDYEIVEESPAPKKKRG